MIEVELVTASRTVSLAFATALSRGLFVVLRRNGSPLFLSVKTEVDESGERYERAELTSELSHGEQLADAHSFFAAPLTNIQSEIECAAAFDCELAVIAVALSHVYNLLFLQLCVSFFLFFFKFYFRYISFIDKSLFLSPSKRVESRQIKNKSDIYKYILRYRLDERYLILVKNIFIP